MSGDSVFLDIQHGTDGRNRKTDAERLQNYREALLKAMHKEDPGHVGRDLRA